MNDIAQSPELEALAKMTQALRILVRRQLPGRSAAISISLSPGWKSGSGWMTARRLSKKDFSRPLTLSTRKTLSIPA